MQKQKQQQDEAAAATSKKKKVTAAQLRVQKGMLLFWFLFSTLAIDLGAC